MRIKNYIPLVDLKAQYKSIKSDIDAAMQNVLDKTDFIIGNKISELEEKFADFIGIHYAIGVSSGTDALHLALYSLGIGKGDEVILPSHTFTACAEPVVLLGAKPVFIDIDERTYNINPDLLNKFITKRTKAIIPVHLYGQPADLNQIIYLAQKNNIYIIEDCAQAHGATLSVARPALSAGAEIKMSNAPQPFRAKLQGEPPLNPPAGGKGGDGELQWKKVGSIGDMGCFSFYPGKNMGAYGDAGMVVTNDSKLAHKIRLLRNHGRTEKYTHEIIGFGNRLDTIQASILLVKLKYLARWNKLRRAHASYYSKLLSDMDKITVPFQPDYSRSVYHLYVIRVKKRDKLREYLKTKGIETGIHYPIPLHRQPAYKYLGYKKGDFPVTEKIVDEIISLPMYPELTNIQINYICQCIKDFYS